MIVCVNSCDAINLSPPPPLPSSQVNPERVGFYRVAYSSDLFSNLTTALSSHTLSACDRLGLQNDAFAMVSVAREIHFTCSCVVVDTHVYMDNVFYYHMPSGCPCLCHFLQARAGVGSTVDVLDLFSSYSSETSYTVWESLVSRVWQYRYRNAIVHQNTGF